MGGGNVEINFKTITYGSIRYFIFFLSLLPIGILQMRDLEVLLQPGSWSVETQQVTRREIIYV